MVQYDKIIINGRERIRAWSDLGMKIERDGQLYDDAVDPVGSGRTYTETDVPILAEEAEEADYLEALERFGVRA